VIGYNDALHLAPAVMGAVLFFLGLALVRTVCYGETIAED
jgi:hypothetical protein